MMDIKKVNIKITIYLILLNHLELDKKSNTTYTPNYNNFSIFFTNVN